MLVAATVLILMTETAEPVRGASDNSSRQLHIYELTEKGLTAPVLVRDVAAVIPEGFSPNEVPDNVQVRAILPIDGTPIVVEVVRPDDLKSELEKAVISAFERWRFQPARLGKTNVTVRITAEVTFKKPQVIKN